MLGLSVATAKKFLKTAVAETVNGGGYNWNDEMVSRHIEESIQERFWYPSVIFAVDNGKPVGCILFGLQGNIAPWIRDDVVYKKVFIDTLYVSPEYRRQGIAKLLIRMAVAEHASETAPVILNVLASNENALALYQSIGFKMFSFHSAYYRIEQNPEEFERQWQKARVLSKGHELESREVDVTSDEFILQLLGKGLKDVNGGQSIFKLNWEKVFSGPLAWRRRYYGKRGNGAGHEISHAVSLLKMLWEHKNIGVYLDGKIVGFYSLWMPLGQMTYLCILPTTDGKAAKIAGYMLKDAIRHLSNDNKRKKGFHPCLEISPVFQFSYLCVTDKEREFWKRDGVKLSSMMLLANRNTIERKTILTDRKQEKLPADMQLCYAVATGNLPTTDICGRLTAQDWLYLVAGLRKRNGHHQMTFACKNWSIFSQETLVTLFTAGEIYEEDFLNHIDRSKLTSAQWARIIWVDNELIPQCPKEIWKQFTPAIWEKVMAHNAIKEWYFGTVQELINIIYYDNKVKEFFQEHPEYADKFPIGSSYHYHVSTQEIMGYGPADSEGVPYPDLLLEHDFSGGQEFIFCTDDDISDKGDLE